MTLSRLESIVGQMTGLNSRLKGIVLERCAIRHARRLARQMQRLDDLEHRARGGDWTDMLLIREDKALESIAIAFDRLRGQLATLDSHGALRRYISRQRALREVGRILQDAGVCDDCAGEAVDRLLAFK